MPFLKIDEIAMNMGISEDDERRVLALIIYVMKSLCFNNGNFSKVSQIYGVSDNAIRKWCKKYNMPFHSKDYKNIKTKQPYRKQVEQIDLNSGKVINIYNSIADAARALGMNTSTHITEVCQGIYKSAGGYGWKYKE